MMEVRRANLQPLGIVAALRVADAVDRIAPRTQDRTFGQNGLISASAKGEREGQNCE